jgi:3-demethoxyubiquinol 3-hydroxylase
MNTPNSQTSSWTDVKPKHGLDAFLGVLDTALRTVAATAVASRTYPPQAGAVAALDGSLNESQKRLSAALMRVNHVGEVCAQALYASQALGTATPAVKVQLEQAAREETDHLAWTERRLEELGGRVSLLNPLWFAGAFAMGLVAARISDKASLGFVVETERQVEQHLRHHLSRLPEQDHSSRAIVAQMALDEASHGAAAQAAGAQAMPWYVRGLMRAAAKVMTTTAHYV